eukprot:TRINITY_DN2806_c0_g2_i1.p1 TRINITY_DN2806_c0_g2~~TRINITY_DN2806_c0_g2_i1.p1  ORF type:complete len:111 (-),score=7.63 TRINITY_DN2806_c0_g2_i1:23-355(-)
MHALHRTLLAPIPSPTPTHHGRHTRQNQAVALRFPRVNVVLNYDMYLLTVTPFYAVMEPQVLWHALYLEWYPITRARHDGITHTRPVVAASRRHLQIYRSKTSEKNRDLR